MRGSTCPPRSVTLCSHGVYLDAATDPCVGYIIHEAASIAAPRKLAILGDTSDTSQLTPLVRSTPGRLSLLVHEATDAYIPPEIDARLASRRPPELVASKALERGHSTPVQAGTCAGKWGARQLILNHIGSRCVLFPRPMTNPDADVDFRLRRLARAAGGGSRRCAR